MKTKKTLLILLTLIISQSGIYAQWIDIYTNTDISLTGIDCINEDTIYAAAYNSYFLRSFDKGETWETIYPGFEIYAQDIEFPNAKTGYIIGCTGKIAKTTDYGNNWNLITTDTLLRLDRVDFINPDTGYIIADGSAYGYSGIILQTLNGGESWNYQFIKDYVLLDIKMINYSKGYIGITTWTFGDEYGFLKTSDAGESWNLSLPEADNITSISFINDETGYCLGMFGPEGGLFKTVDGGDNWSFTQGGVGGLSVNRLQFIDEQTGFYSGWEATFDDGLISRTDDGGNTWNEQETGCFFDFEMINADTG